VAIVFGYIEEEDEEMEVREVTYATICFCKTIITLASSTTHSEH
jgi:hypothetical protein